MSKAKAAVAEVDAWIDTLPQRRAYRCLVCSDQRCADVVDLVIARIQQRGDRVTQRDVLEMLIDRFKYKGTEGGLRWHISHCRKVRWSELAK